MNLKNQIPHRGLERGGAGVSFEAVQPDGLPVPENEPHGMAARPASM
ncbi:MAG: hypothetical protein LBQ32_12565 [Burkholderiaceae bacterium]|jgi:hypothetical protein|nr:hypothetical protein [Burkholderiaceae bacterium]